MLRITTFGCIYLLAVSIFGYRTVIAKETNINVSATFRSAIATTILDHMSFGTIFFNSPDIGDVALSPDGEVTYGRNIATTVRATPARVQLAGSTGTEIAITCSRNASIGHDEHTLSIQNIRFKVGGLNEVSDCNGVGGTATNYNLTGDSNQDVVNIGATLVNESGEITEGVYSFAEGSPITLRLMYL